MATRLALLVAAAGLADGLQVPLLRHPHALVASTAQRSGPVATMGFLDRGRFLNDAQGQPDAQRIESAARVHDYFNIAATSVMSALTIAARFNGAWNLRLAYVMGG